MFFKKVDLQISTEFSVRDFWLLPLISFNSVRSEHENDKISYKMASKTIIALCNWRIR